MDSSLIDESTDYIDASTEDESVIVRNKKPTRLILSSDSEEDETGNNSSSKSIVDFETKNEVSDSDAMTNSQSEADVTDDQNISDTNEDVISSDDELLPINYSGNKIFKQSTLTEFLDVQNVMQSSPDTYLTEKKLNNSEDIKDVSSSNENVLQIDYDQQKQLVETVKRDYCKITNLIDTMNLNLLPDNGVLLIKKRDSLQIKLEEAEVILNKMVVKKVEQQQYVKNIPNWQLLQSEASAVQPRTFGQQALATINQQRSLTMERLQQLHKSLATCPEDTAILDDPKGLKVELLPHQKYALNWLTWREKQKPSGGILADDMGLGKTLTMISLLLKCIDTRKSNEESSSDDSDGEDSRKTKYTGGTLIICPASLINHWESEVHNKLKRGKLSVEVFHGNKRESSARKLSKLDVVVTTYSIASVEFKKAGVIFDIKWRRIILDEAHNIRNYKAQTAQAACELSAKSRWALTGTPVHNKELDLYSLLKFLRCSPFDDLSVWKRWVTNKTTGGQERLNTVISSLLLRRTKEQLIQKGALGSMPERSWKLIEVNLNKAEMDLYQRLLILSKTLFAQYLHQRAEKNCENVLTANFNVATNDPNDEYYKLHKKLVNINKMKTIKQHEILVLLLKLRQLCCHPNLVNSSMNFEENAEMENTEEMDLLKQLNNMNLNENQENMPINSNENHVGVMEAIDSILPNSSVFDRNRVSSKVQVILDLLKNEVLPTQDKCVIVSQWTSFLDLIAIQLERNTIKFERLDGRVPVPKRMNIVDSINDNNDSTQILLLSLTSGGVGLNLVGANHLFLLDLHWNPQLEIQAQDRIYRFGQKKPVFIYKFMAVHTVEEQVLSLQKKKMNLADAILSGAKIQQTALSLDDLKMLFNM